MHGVNVNRCHHIEAGLLNSQGESTGTSKQIDSNGPPLRTQLEFRM